MNARMITSNWTLMLLSKPLPTQISWSCHWTLCKFCSLNSFERWLSSRSTVVPTVVTCFNVQGGPSSVVGIATGYGLDGPWIESRWGSRFAAPVQTCPGAHPASCTVDTGSFPGVKSGRGVILTPHPLLVPWSRKGRAVPLLPLWAVRPVQSLSACTRVHFTV
jgi:hypothetical protein